MVNAAGTDLNAIKFTVACDGPPGDYVVPIKHINDNVSFAESGPRLCMTAKKTLPEETSEDITATVVFQTPGYYMIDEGCLNAKYPNLYSCERLVVEVV